MTERSPLERAKALSLRALAARTRTEQQVRRRLERAGLEAQADEVTAWLRRLGYLDDAAWALAAAGSLLRPGRLGPGGAERRLVQSGIAPARAREAVARALAEARPGEAGESAEVALCRALVLRRSPGARPADLDERARARLARFLLGRGFSGEAVERVVGLGAGDG